MPKQTKQINSKILKILFMALGILAVGLGVLGVFVPLLPTTAFLLLAAALFMKSSDRLYNWLMNHKYLGTFIKNYLHHKTIPLKTKIAAISLLWLAILSSIIFAVEMLIIRLLLLVIAIGVTWHILSFKSHNK